MFAKLPLLVGHAPISDYFVYKSANLYPRIKVRLFLGSAQGGLLKNVRNKFSRQLGSRDITKTQVHTFFRNTLYNLFLDIRWDNGILKVPIEAYENFPPVV